MSNDLISTNQASKLALAKAKNLLELKNKILANRPSKELLESFENFRFSPSLGHSSGVNSVAVTPDGRYIVSGSRDSTIKLWDISSGKLLCSYVAITNGEWLVWTADGEYNCSDGAYKYFCFVDDSKGIPEVVPESHPVYKQKKKDILLRDYTGGTNPYAKNPPLQTDVPRLELDIDDDEISF